MKYIRKSALGDIEVFAIQYTGENEEEILKIIPSIGWWNHDKKIYSRGAEDIKCGDFVVVYELQYNKMAIEIYPENIFNKMFLKKEVQK